MQLRFDSAAPDQTRATLRAFIEAGATHIVLYMSPPYPQDGARRMAGEIVEPLLAEFAGRA
jgi:hypothetical protein